MATQVASLFALLFLKDSMSPGLKQADNSLDSFSGKLTNTGKKLQGMGQKMTLWTAPLTLGLMSSVKMATNFEKSMANVGAILGDSADEMEDLSDAILEMGANSVAGPQAVADAYFDVVSGIADATSHIDIMQAAINTAEAGQADLGATTSAIIGVMNAYSFSAAQAGMASDIMTATVGAGVLTMNELAVALPNVSNLSAELGISFGEISGSLALLTKGGTSATVASTQLRAAMTALIKPNEDMKRALSELGFESGEAALDALGLQGTLDALTDTTIAADVGMAAILGSTEALGAALGLAGDDAAEFLLNFRGLPTEAQLTAAEMRVLMGEFENVEAALESLGLGFDDATEKAQAIQNASPSAQFAILASNAEAVGIKIGQVLLPALAELSEDLLPIVDSIADWIDNNPKLTKGILGLTLGLIILGPALGIVGTGLTVIGGASSAVAVIGGLGAAVSKTTAFGALAAGLTAILAPLMSLMLPFIAFGFVLLGVIWLADQAAKALGFEGIGDLLQQSLDIWTNNFDMAMIIIQEFVTQAANWIADAFIKALNIVVRALNLLIKGFNALSSLIGGPIIDELELLSRTAEGVKGVPEDVTASVLAYATALAAAGLGPNIQVSPTGEFLGIRPGGIPGGGDTTDVGALFTPVIGRAAGGNVFRGMPTIVGEKGPELFMPGSNGTIIPHHVAFGGDRALAAPVGNGGNGRQININGNITVIGVQDVSQMLDELEREAGFRATPA